MRLVGASNIYITVPFLLGAVISALIGVALACLTMAAGVYFWIIRGARNSIRFIAWIGWSRPRSPCSGSRSSDWCLP